MDPRDQLPLRRLVDDRLAKLDVTMAELARRSGLSRAELYRIYNGEVSEPSPHTLQRLARGLGISNSAVLASAYGGYIRPTRRELRPSQHSDSEVDWVTDLTYPDNSIVATGQVFIKAWRIQNVGRTTWQDWQLVNVDNPAIPLFLRPTCDTVPVPTTRPGETVDLSVELQAPILPGTTISRWKLRDASGQSPFPDLVGIWCQVVVSSLR